MSIVTDEVISGLRKEVLKGNHSSMWSAKALGLLGDTDFLLNNIGKKELREDVLNGISTIYQSWVNYCVHPQSLDFRPLKNTLEKYSFSQEILEKNLALGGGYRCIGKEDIDEALDGLDSSWELIRQLSVCFLGDKSLGKKDGKRILLKLAECLTDSKSEIRRLAIFSIMDWGKEAVVYISHIEKLYNDGNEQVREIAIESVHKLSEKYKK
jgi:hypothetical protein